MKIVLKPDGTIRSLYDEWLLDNVQEAIPKSRISDCQRASEILWDSRAGGFYVHLGYDNNLPQIFSRRSEAIAAEVKFLEDNMLETKECGQSH